MRFTIAEAAAIVMTFRNWSIESLNGPPHHYIASKVTDGYFDEKFIPQGESLDAFVLMHKLGNLTEAEATEILDNVSQFWGVHPTTDMRQMLEEVGLIDRVRGTDTPLTDKEEK